MGQCNRVRLCHPFGDTRMEEHRGARKWTECRDIRPIRPCMEFVCSSDNIYPRLLDLQNSGLVGSYEMTDLVFQVFGDHALSFVAFPGIS